MATTDIFTVTGSLFPARAAIRCLGGDVDDYIQVNAWAAARTAANDTKGSFSAWIMIPDITGTYTIIGAGGNAVDDYIDFNIEAGLLTCRCEDGGVVQFVSQEDAIGLTAHRWHHVAVVQPANGAGVKFYIDGKLTASTNDTATDVDEWFINLDNIDRGHIGASNAGGAGTYAQEFKGYISDVKYWNRALDAGDILLDFEGTAQPNTTAKKDATYLQSHWDFKDDLVDNGLGADNGTNTGAGIVLNNASSEFSSRLSFMSGTLITASHLRIAINENMGLAYVVLSA